MGNETNTRDSAKAPSIATSPPRSVLLTVSSGVEIPSGKPVGEAEVVDEAMTHGLWMDIVKSSATGLVAKLGVWAVDVCLWVTLETSA
jgi:hypothetical protein